MSLDEKRKKYDIPAIPYLPKAQNCLVYRLNGEEKTAGGLFIPDEHKEIKTRGVLLAAGCEAMDELADGLIEIGDEVCCAHYAGRDRKEEGRQAGEVARSVWEMKVQDILGSVEAVERSKNYEMVLQTDSEGNRWHIWKEKK